MIEPKVDQEVTDVVVRIRVIQEGLITTVMKTLFVR